MTEVDSRTMLSRAGEGSNPSGSAIRNGEQLIGNNGDRYSLEG